MANRKLQAEIDKVLKQVSQGVEAFEAIYVKIGPAPVSQKEKLEADLKKEIKKLQRFRDQIKTWIGSSEVKDKKPLTDNRRLIEMQMEKFKACEKELKTKAFSKEGLLIAQKMDPAERERMELAETLKTIIESLETQIDAFEFEVEKLKTGMGKKKDTAKSEKVAKFEHGLERHKHHIKMIEIVLRLLENGDIDADPVKSLIDDVNYYAESNQDDDFEEDEGIYDDLNLDDAEAYGINPEDDDSDISDDDDSSKQTPKVDSKSSEDLKKKAKEAADVTPAMSPQKGTIKVVPAKIVPKEEVKPPAGKPVVTSATKSIPPPPMRMPSSDVPAVVTPMIPQSTIRYAAAAAAVVTPSVVSGVPSNMSSTSIVNTVAQSTTVPAAVLEKKSSAIEVSLPTVPQIAQQPQQQTASAPSAPQQQQSISFQSNTPVVSKPQQDGSSNSTTQQEPLDNRLPPALKDMVTSFVLTKERSTLKTHEESILFSHMLETSFRHIPEPLDCEKQKHYVPQTSYPTPSYYPQHPLAVFDNPAVFEKFEIDTLFYIFYHLQGTYQQFLAARELKKQSWRFHKKYNTWFQRFEQPNTITDDFEQGAYVYFDYEGSWCQRKKSDFRFDYKWLEDESV
ncbi:hypothetical protein CcCBS67573_g05527 [Chytriomyces confervae]|uniref:General negative regulator of transcription subunit n=1 Tax=Chytriomyces confervae TaxID=246404 RepID=A0A507FA44_9FUNG|nr:hypothetical protein CcCBS67573_g05527 [Chytriomyces confervae]